MADCKRLSLNQITVERWSALEAIEGCLRHQIPSISFWRHKIADSGLSAVAKKVREAGLHVSSVCRGGLFVVSDSDERRKRIEDNLRAIDEAAELKADTLVIVAGASADVPIADGRRMIQDGLAAIVPHAAERGVTLGLEPLHPMFAGDRCALVTVREALSYASAFPAERVGVVLDAYHIWWDAELSANIAASKGRIFGFHVCDWLSPLPDMLMGRGMMGDGVIDLPSMHRDVNAAGYTGPIEVEIFNQKIWEMDGDEILPWMKQRFESHV
jgi:sugar phosphate isomerase/epimerase